MAVAKTAGTTAPSVEPLIALVGDDLARVNETILEHMRSDVALIPQLAGHLIAAGGKRLRPLLTLGAARLVGYEGDRHVKLAACVEFIHTATLLHDDVVDESDMRRGRQSANAVWGNQASVLVGDFLFSRAFQLMVADGSLEVLRILSNASAVIAEGEVQQLVTTGDIETDEAAYLSVIRGKTAQLFAAATRIGPVVAGRPDADADSMERFGAALGTAFQLVDDALDYSAEQERLGKTIGDDFREGKMTLPVILAYAAGDTEEKAFWRRSVEGDEQQPGDLAHAQDLIRRHGALEQTMARARDQIEEARGELRRFDAGPIRDALDEILDFCVKRAY